MSELLAVAREEEYVLSCGHCHATICTGLMDPMKFARASAEHHLNECPDCPNRDEIAALRASTQEVPWEKMSRGARVVEALMRSKN